MKRSTRRLIITLALAFAALAGCSRRGAPSGTGTKEDVGMELSTPSERELVIAPGRHFKVSGKFTGEVPDDAVLRVSLCDMSGKELRYAETDRKGTDRTAPSLLGDRMTILVPGSVFSDVAFTAPELAVRDPEDPEASFRDATVKCVYTDDTFYALIVSATDTEHGLFEDDGFNLTGPDGQPYSAFPEGRYTVRAVLSSADGETLAEASEEITVGFKSGTIIHEITNPAVIEKGGMELLNAFAEKEDLTMLCDLLPCMFGPFYQMTFLPMSVSCETPEYLHGRIAMILYGNWDMSPSNGLELAKYLQAEHTVNDPRKAEFYFFSLGEPSIAGERAEIVKLGEDEMIHICRVDAVSEDAKDGIFLTGEEQILSSDTDSSDGWTAGDGAFAVAGVLRPYQLKDEEIVPDEEMSGFYHLLNGADRLVYTFTAVDGSHEFTVEKPAGVSRAVSSGDAPGMKALYEFYSVFLQGHLRKGPFIRSAYRQLTETAKRSPALPAAS